MPGDRAARPATLPSPSQRVGGLILATTLLVLGSCAAPPEPEPAQEPAPEPPAVDPGWRMRSVDTSIEVELPEPFVKLVDLARLRVGMTKAEVLAIFPDPYEIELRQGDEFWQYRFAELIFRNGRLRDWFNL